MFSFGYYTLDLFLTVANFLHMIYIIVIFLDMDFECKCDYGFYTSCRKRYISFKISAINMDWISLSLYVTILFILCISKGYTITCPRKLTLIQIALFMRDIIVLNLNFN